MLHVLVAPTEHPVQVDVPADEAKRLQVFIAHAGEQKKGFVNVMHVLLQDMYKLKVFVDEWSLEPDDNSLPVIQQQLAAAAVVVVVLTQDFVSKKYPMEEVRQIIVQREAGTKQRLCIVWHHIDDKECRKHVLDGYADDLNKLLSITAMRSDQARHCDGVEARDTVKVVIQLLIKAGQLPPGYGDLARNQLARPPQLLGRADMLQKVQDILQNQRMLLLAGSPGEGKSAVIAEAAHRMSDDGLLPGGVFKVDLAGVLPGGGKSALAEQMAKQLSAVCSTMKGAWRLGAQGGWEELLSWLQKAADTLLIVVENVEHALHDRASAQALLQLVGELLACPKVSVAVVSRIKLVSGSQAAVLPPLDHRSAVDLLRRHCCARSAALLPDAADELVRLCGCNALLVRVLGGVLARCLQLEAGLQAAHEDGPLSVLQDTRRGGPREDVHIGRVLKWLKRYLRAEDVQTLSSLALFRGSFSGEAAAAVLQPVASAAAALLQNLADDCLVAHACFLTGRLHHYSLHPLVWDLAECTRREKPEPQRLLALEAFLRWMLACAERHSLCSSGEATHAAQHLAGELPNIRALAAQLSQPPLCDSAAVDAADTLSTLHSLSSTLQSIGQPAVAAALQAVLAARQRKQGFMHDDPL